MVDITQRHIEECIKNMAGKFHLNDLMRLLNLDKSQYGHLKTAVGRACDKGIARSLGGRDGWYRQIDEDYELLHFKLSNPAGFFPIKYPFQLEEYVKTPRRSVVVIGGAPQAGKTAFVHNLIHLNWREHKTICWDSENSEAELQERLVSFDDYMEWPDDTFRSRSTNYEDVIKQNPDGLNIVDYIEVPDNPWELGTIIRNIRDALGMEGIAVVCLQKPEGRDLPYGKERVKQLPRIVIVMEKGILKILKGKSWAKKDTNPDGLRWSYKLVGGEKFVNIEYLGKQEKVNW